MTPQTRDAWDRAHAIGAILAAVAFFALLVEALFPLRGVSVESARVVATH